MSMLTVEGFAVNILPGTQLSDAQHGDSGRSFSGKMRTDYRASHRVGRVVASYLSTDNDATAFRAILASPGPLTLGGTMIGDDAYFHVRNVEFAHVTADLLQFSFDVMETDESPSPLLFSFDGDAPGTYTTTRASTATYTDEDGVLQTAGSHRARWENLWLDGVYGDAVPDTRAGLLEAARTNLVSSDAISGWLAFGSPVVTTTIDDPAGGTGAYRVADDAAGATEFVFATVSFTGDAVKTVVFVVREASMPVAGSHLLQLYDSSAGAARLALLITAWATGTPTVSASTGTYLGKRYVGNGYWALYAQSTSVTAANTNYVRIVPANDDPSPNQTGSIDVYRVNAYNSTVPSWSIMSASQVRIADVWYGTFSAVPQEMTVYIKMIEAGAAATTNGSVLYIGDGSSTDPRLAIQSGGTYYSGTHDPGTASQSTLATAPAWGDTVELRMTLSAAGLAMLYQSINAGSEVTGSTPSASALAVAWSGTRLYIGSEAGSNQGMNPILAVRVVQGTRTMAEMRDWARARLHPHIEPDVVGALSVSRSIAVTAEATARVTMVPVLA